MKEMFPAVSIAEFHPGQVLYPILKICVASMIMHNPQVECDCTVQNIVSSMLRDAAERAGISDSRIPANLGRQHVLNYWSDLIEQDYKQQLNLSTIESIASQPGPMQLVCNLLIQTLNENKGMMEEIKCMRHEMKNVIRESVSTNVTSVAQDSQIQALSQRLEKAERKLSCFLPGNYRVIYLNFTRYLQSGPELG
jgi:hypothetical protein